MYTGSHKGVTIIIVLNIISQLNTFFFIKAFSSALEEIHNIFTMYTFSVNTDHITTLQAYKRLHCTNTLVQVKWLDYTNSIADLHNISQ